MRMCGLRANRMARRVIIRANFSTARLTVSMFKFVGITI